jgi:hypothetical protein
MLNAARLVLIAGRQPTYEQATIQLLDNSLEP